MNDKHYTLIEHLTEIRQRLIKSLIALTLVFSGLFYFANSLYQILADPLLRALPAGHQMIATQVATPFTTPLKLTLFVSLLVTLPYLLYQIWAFIAPALFKHEKKRILPLIMMSSALFYIGMAFAYFFVFPLMFKFFAETTPVGVQVSTDISAYLDFVLGMLFAFGISFQVPIGVWILCWIGITTPQSLANKRSYILVGAFTVGMILTPPDVLSQVLLSVPLYLLFEVGLIMGRIYSKPANTALNEISEDIKLT